MKDLFNINLIIVKTLALLSGLASGEAAKDARDRGDVPGWVMITMMTAILVAALLVVARDALINMFNSAMSMVSQ